jgi:hypothetical protein
MILIQNVTSILYYSFLRKWTKEVQVTIINDSNLNGYKDKYLIDCTKQFTKRNFSKKSTGK